MAHSKTLTSFLPLLALSGACATIEDPTWPDDGLLANWTSSVDRAPGVPTLTLGVPDLAIADVTEIGVSGAMPGETILLAFSARGIGPGPCPPPLGGLCLDLWKPGDIGSTVTDASGSGTIPFFTPAVREGRTVCFQAIAERGPGGVDSELSDPACGVTVHLPIYLLFTGLGTFTTPELDLAGVTISGSADVNVLFGNGLGIVGGASDQTIDDSESITFTFDAAATNVSYHVWFGSDDNGDGRFGAAIVEPFNESGSLGVFSVDDLGSKYVSDLVGDIPITGFTVTADVDSHKINTMLFVPSY